MAPNLSKILFHWGLEEEVRSIAVKSQAINLILCMDMDGMTGSIADGNFFQR